MKSNKKNAKKKKSKNSSKSSQKPSNKVMKGKFVFILIIIAVLVGGGIIFANYLNNKDELSPQEAADKTINYINENLLGEGQEASLKEVARENGLYKLKIDLGSQEVDSYVTLNGKLFFPSKIDLTKEVKQSSEETSQNTAVSDLPKQEKPDLKMFVMSYCPYGLQAQKMFVPVYDLLKDKADMSINFVNYAMHDKEELDENLKQYCIQQEQKEKYSAYLNCFLEDGESDECSSEANLNEDLLNSCITRIDEEYSVTKDYNDKDTWLNGRYPKFSVENELNNKYSVQGSPTIVINGESTSLNTRSPEALKIALCQSFTSQPEECSQELSEDVYPPNFGFDTSSANSEGSCE